MAAALISEGGSANPLKNVPLSQFVDRCRVYGQDMVPTLACPRCQSATTRLLDATSELSIVNYYCCERCGLVWNYPKHDTADKDVVMSRSERQKRRANNVRRFSGALKT